MLGMTAVRGISWSQGYCSELARRPWAGSEKCRLVHRTGRRRLRLGATDRPNSPFCATDPAWPPKVYQIVSLRLGASPKKKADGRSRGPYSIYTRFRRSASTRRYDIPAISLAESIARSGNRIVNLQGRSVFARPRRWSSPSYNRSFNFGGFSVCQNCGRTPSWGDG